MQIKHFLPLIFIPLLTMASCSNMVQDVNDSEEKEFVLYNTHYVSFSKNRKSVANAVVGGSMKSQEFVKGREGKLNVCEFQNPSGYEFSGWNTNSSGTGDSYKDGDSFIIGTSNVTLYAVWAKAGRSITYISSIPYSDQLKKTFETTETVLLDEPSADGYEFSGWYLSSDFSGQSVAGWKAGTYTEDVTLYAKWTPVTYTVSFSEDSGVAAMTYTVETASVTLPDPASSDASKIFIGWYKKTADESESPSVQVGSWKAGMRAENLDLVAQWADSASICTVTYTAGENCIGDSYTQIFVKGTGKNLVDCNFTIASGYKFDHWQNGSMEISSDGIKTFNKDMTLTAVVKAVNYTVNFLDENGASGTTGSESFVVNEAKMIPVNGFVRDYYVFDHWYSKRNSDFSCKDEENFTLAEKYISGSESLLESDGTTINLYAVWKADNVAAEITFESETLPDGCSSYCSLVESADGYESLDSKFMKVEETSVSEGTYFMTVGNLNLKAGYNFNITFDACGKADSETEPHIYVYLKDEGSYLEEPFDLGGKGAVIPDGKVQRTISAAVPNDIEGKATLMFADKTAENGESCFCIDNIKIEIELNE